MPYGRPSSLITRKGRARCSNAEAPRFLFPFARAIIANAVRDAGFAPLVLDPIDFQGLYLQQLQSQGGQSFGEAAGGEAN